MELPKAYEPAKYESDIYKLWEKSGAFKPHAHPTPYCIVIPPPNANGNLHTGHAMYTIIDILIRYHRMKGDNTLMFPGTDHAGIETQVVYERDVLAPQGKSRFDLGREEFYRAVMDFTLNNEHNIISQFKSLGLSADWSRKKFTLDSDIIEVVYETFKRLHEDGLIYRGNRIVNWCPRCRSGFADIEIKHRQQIDPLYYIKYGPFVLATVRPETKFGDTAIAVHPKDERYQKWVGKEIEVEGLLGKFKMKVIADEHVDPAFGTGVIKVTPAHDPNDWEIGLRHNLEVKQVIGTDGRLTKLAGKYSGMTVEEARTQVAHDLEERGLMDHIEMNYEHAVAYHGRCGTIIEPLVTEQWWLKVENLVKPAIAAIEQGEVKMVPSRYKKVALDWLKNLRDWNISRQDWWGIRIPVYYNTSADKSKQPYLITSTEAEAEAYYGASKYEAETDVFDTWFSSSQWPYATLMSTDGFEQFYPTSVMATARDLIFLWVSRMIMLGLYRAGNVPFKDVYFWGMVNDEHGKKMSKSRGNVINPLDFTAKYGTDALRLALTIGITAGNDGSLGEKKVEAYRNFCNKLWNVARYILSQTANRRPPTASSEADRGTRKAESEADPTPYTLHPEPSSMADKWILDKFSQAIKSISSNIEKYRFSDAGQQIYSLLWDDLADWYIEASKAEPNLSVQLYALGTILKLAHPFAPFVTETIWQEMPGHDSNLIATPWPESGPRFTQAAKDFEQLKDLISQVRNLKGELVLAKPVLLYRNERIIDNNADLIKKLAGLQKIEQVKQGRGMALPGRISAWLDVDQKTLKDYLRSLTAKRKEKSDYLDRLTKQLSNEAFVKSAPAQIVEDARNRQAQAQMILSKLDEQIKAIGQH